MNTEQILSESINLDDEFKIKEINVDEHKKEIYVKVESRKNKFKCPDCDEACKVHDRILKKWRHVDFVSYKVYIEYRNPRIKCNKHGVKLKEVTWAKPRHKFTTTMEEFIYDLSKKIPLSHVGKVIDEHDTRVKRVISKLEKRQEND